MKSRIIRCKPKLLWLNLDMEKLEKLKNVAKKIGVDVAEIDKTMGGEKVGYLCGYSGFSKGDSEKTAISEECLLFVGFDKKSLDTALEYLHEYGLVVNLKAVVTEYNQKYTLSKLVEELCKEHELMNGGVDAK